MVVNYSSRFEIAPGKFVYLQMPAYRVSGLSFLDDAGRHWFPPRWYFHFAKGGHVAALKQHLHSEIFAAVDIDSFFASVTKTKLLRALKKIGYSFSDAREIAADSTVRTGRGFALPYGFVQSPYLATLALAKSALGQKLADLRRRGLVVTVYMDDIVISHPDSHDTVDAALEEIFEAAKQSSFTLNGGKLRGPAVNISVFNIALRTGNLEITDDRLLDFREHVIANGDTPSSRGVIGYVRTVNAVQAAALAAELS